MTELRAIPSRYVKALDPPAGAIERALAAFERLGAEDQDERLFGFLEPHAIRASWYSPDRVMTVVLDGVHFWAVGWGVVRCVDLRWTVLSQTDDWYEEGWLPSEGWAGLDAKWRARIWRAIQPLEARRLAIP